MDKQTFRKRLVRSLGSGAQFEEVDGILVVHLDNPDAKEIQKRREEVRGDLFRPEDDCPLCRQMAQNKPEAVVFDQDAVLCLGSEAGGMFTSAFPRAPAHAA